MLRLFQISLLYSIFILSSCSTEKHLTSTLDLVITLQRTPCYGECPVYNFQALNNGEATLTVGRFGTDKMELDLKEGDYSGEISTVVVDEIIQYAKAADYFTLNNEYDDKRVMDLPAIILNIDGHRVFNRFEGPNLEDLYSFIESKISDVQWHSINEN